MVMVNGIKFSCATCIRGHRSANCVHPDRPLTEVRKKGRPPTQCLHCRELRKTKQVHAKCACPREEESPLIVLPNGIADAMLVKPEPSTFSLPTAGTSTERIDHLTPLQALDQQAFAVPGQPLSRRSSSARSQGTSRSSHSEGPHELVHAHTTHHLHTATFSPYAAPHAHGPRLARASSTSSSRSHRTDFSFDPDLATPAATPQHQPVDLSADIEALFQQFDPSALHEALEATATTRALNELWIGGERRPASASSHSGPFTSPPLSDPIQSQHQQLNYDFTAASQNAMQGGYFPTHASPLPVRSELVDLHDSVQSYQEGGSSTQETDIMRWASDLAGFDWSSLASGAQPLNAVVGVPPFMPSPSALPAENDLLAHANPSPPPPHSSLSQTVFESSSQESARQDLFVDPDMSPRPQAAERERLPLWQTKTVTVANARLDGTPEEVLAAEEGDEDDEDDDDDDDEGREFYDENAPHDDDDSDDQDEDEDEDDEDLIDGDNSNSYADDDNDAVGGTHTPHASSFSDLYQRFGLEQFRDYAPSNASSSSVASSSFGDFEPSASNSSNGGGTDDRFSDYGGRDLADRLASDFYRDHDAFVVGTQRPSSSTSHRHVTDHHDDDVGGGSLADFGFLDTIKGFGSLDVSQQQQTPSSVSSVSLSDQQQRPQSQQQQYPQQQQQQQSSYVLDDFGQEYSS